MPHNPHHQRCDEIITETTRLRLAIDEREQYPGREAQQQAARLWVQYHRAMVELLVMRPAHDRDAKARQISTAQQHQARAEHWGGVVEQLAQEAAQEGQAEA